LQSYEFASNPEKAGLIVVFNLKSPDLAVRNEIINGKSLGDEIYVRVTTDLDSKILF